MPSDRTTGVARRFEIAEGDLKRAALLLSVGDLPGTGFNLQQAIEKSLKGFLTSRGVKPRKIDTLETLLNEAAKHEPKLARDLDACEAITEYHFTERHPDFEGGPLDLQEAQSHRVVAEEMCAELLRLAGV